MRVHVRFGVVGCALVLSLPAAGLAFGPLGTAFTYQGRLLDGGLPVDGVAAADLRFRVWDSATVGSPVTATLTFLDVTIDDGLFTRELEFGVNVFDGNDRWLEVEAAVPAGSAFVPLAPRQRLSATPYALQTRGMFVDSNNDVDLVGVMHIDESTSFLGVNRGARLSSSEFFGVDAPTSPAGYGGMFINTTNATGNPYYGYATANSSDAWTYVDGTTDQWKLNINGDRLTVNGSNGRVGVGTTTPAARLDVADGDVAVTDAGVTQVQLGGVGPGGELSVRNDDGAETIELLGGASGSVGTLSMFNATTGSQTVAIDGDFNGRGANIRTFSEDGFTQSYIGPDIDEGAIVFWMGDNSKYGMWFYGNADGAGNPLMSILGTPSSMQFNATSTGNASVVLPTDAIDSTEILGEPGVASALNGNSVLVSSTTLTTLLSRTITAPTSGYVLVMGACQPIINHVTGTDSQYNFGVSDSWSSLPANQDVGLVLDAALPTGTYDFSSTPHGLFSVSAGANTFYLSGQKILITSPTISVYDLQLTLMFIPTAYGTVTSTLTALGTDDGNDGEAPGPGLTLEDIEAEQLEAEEFHQQRIERELQQMQAQVQALQARLDELVREQGLDQPVQRTPRTESPISPESGPTEDNVLAENGAVANTR